MPDRFPVDEFRLHVPEHMALPRKGNHGERFLERYPATFAVLVIDDNGRVGSYETDEDRQQADHVAGPMDSDLGLQQVNDPDVDKPVYRLPPPDGPITLSAAFEERISATIREAREGRNLSRSKLAPLLGLKEAVYARYETSVFRLTVGRPRRQWRGVGRAIAPRAAERLKRMNGHGET